MTTPYNTADFAIKAGFAIMAVVALVFAAMLGLTVLHP